MMVMILALEETLLDLILTFRLNEIASVGWLTENDASINLSHQEEKTVEQ